MSGRSQLSRSPSRKHLKIGCTNDESRLSNLPDSIISQILSCLPTKDAVQTSVLSKDWEYKWTSIYNIDIDDKKLFSRQKSKKMTFVNFVERILLLSRNMKCFRLSCSEKYEATRLTTWMSAVLRRNVECFEVICLQSDIVLPRSLLSCPSLRKLKLNLPCTFRVPSKNCFPNLKILYLEGVEILNENSNTASLEFTFPVLDTFHLVRCKWLNVKIVKIYAPAMTTFICETPSTVKVKNYYHIKIFGASLTNFGSFGTLLENFLIPGAPIACATLVNSCGEGDLRILEKSGVQARMLLKEFRSLEELKLSGYVVKAIAQSRNRAPPPPPPPLPTYNKLERLVVTSSCSNEAVLELLHMAPSLKFLVVDVLNWDDCDYDAMEPVPSCIISHLEEVEFNHFVGTTPQLKVAKFLLKNATELKKVHLCSSGLQLSTLQKNATVEQLSTMPKRSAYLTIVVS
ncbi:hypothetical protein ACJIZ3_001147 [Penstemon smallii]|uniref:F-box domain-containing protein n=1 Tax=Penstemon smallii TaxID=265156 RepID=A0ABD3U2S5_9LAMI